ncbi:MAG: UDP-N-acetylglucosamine 2-epimerase (non-hydrolyzing) [Candidatus Margulisbacteria bacterium]|jgi:UDP-N-acetylglucosamine 2-epimerase (non-hydrolysing)|nr:UDP-N-acetylglucosamine 2-epimerase (non-hydrolyzing) [Candidatus Margulisiibacteriota bacterium]
MSEQKKALFVFGTRPEAIKMAPVIKQLQRQDSPLTPLVAVTAQHRQMLDQVLNLFKIEPDYDLDIMEADQTLTTIINKSLTGLAEVIMREKPDILLAQGDTSTAFAAGLSAYYHRVPLAHVEAGLRTYDKWRPFPEEMNRQQLTALADIHFPPTASALDNLLKENVPRERIYLTGNTVIDALLDVVGRKYDLARAGIELRPGRKLVLVTVHRRESFGAPLLRICRALKRLADKFAGEIDLIIPVHRNPQVRSVVYEQLGESENVTLVEPLDYEPFVHLMKAAYLILSDSGGVQEEAPSLGKPALVLREKTERPEAITAGAVKLVGMDEELIFNEASRLLTDSAEYRRMSQVVNPYGDGQASLRIGQALAHYLGLTAERPEEFDAAIAH